MEKDVETLELADLSLGDRCNIDYTGTNVTRGQVIGIAFATGMQTELGRIASLLDKSSNQLTPLQKRLASFNKKLALAILLVAAVVFEFEKLLVRRKGIFDKGKN